MLQKIDKDRLDEVLATIEFAKIKFPNATITKDLGVHGGTVSEYLNGVKPMSSNFYRKFMDKYGKQEAVNKTNDSTLDRLINNNTELIEAHVSVAKATEELAKANKELSEANKELTLMLKNSVNSNGQNSYQNLAEKVLHRIAEKGVPELWATKEEGMSKLNKYLIGAPPDITESNKLHKEGKSSIS